jgi:hypothetical protein
MKFNEEDVRKFYNFFLHKNPTEIRVFDAQKYPQGKSIFVNNRNEFVDKCRKYTEEGVSVYIGARDRSARGDKNVVSSNFIFFEIDEHGENKDSEKQKILEFLTSKGIEVSMIGFSGGGWHFYIPHKMQEFVNEEAALQYKDTSLSMFKQVMLGQGFDVDPAVFNLERVTRVLGTYNYKRNKISYIEKLNEHIDIEKNTKNLIPMVQIMADTPSKRDEFVYNIDDDDLIKQVKEKWVEGGREKLAVYLAGYLRKNKRLGLDSAINIVRNICMDCNDDELESRLVAVRATYNKDEKDIMGIKGLNEREIDVDIDLDWKEIKSKLKKEFGDGEEYYPTDINWRFISNNKNTITGKPQLIDAIKKNIILGRETIKKEKIEGEDGKKKDVELRKIILFDDKFDKRYSGPVISSFSMKFYLYRVIEKNGEEHYILSEEYLPNEVCTFTGMKVEVEDFAEISKSMRIGCLTSVFFMKEYKSNVVTMSPDNLIEFTKHRKINEDDWLKFLAYHRELDSFNRFPYETEILKSAHLLSSKVDGWPLHIGIIGPQGTKKSKGFIETIAHKMDDNPDIVEGANSRIKGLTPSFKEKPANLGYFANCNRMGWVDELGKMVEFEMNKHTGGARNVLGEANFLLEHSTRQVSSGNDNTVTVGATAKFCFVTNPISYKKTIGDHVGCIDPTTMSRILWWVQDVDEQEFVISNQGIVRNNNKSPPNKDNPPNTISRNFIFMREKESKAWLSVGGKIESIDEFLTIYDSCNNFKCFIDKSKVEELANTTTTLAREPMKGVWKPRAEHHIELLIDGICKHRCLFIDYDNSFEANEKDYNLAERILIRMIKGWDTDLSIKK